MKKEVNREFPKFVPWENVDYHEKTTKYFAKVKGLPSTSLNPKISIIIEHMTTKDIVEVFGLDCSSFKTKTLICTLMLTWILSSFIGKFMDWPL
jgi:hypothetical protein